jgi:hypothetical protein
MSGRLALALCAVVMCGAAAIDASQRALVITCTNPSSGASWQISVDLEHGTVDANPATISATEISWRDVKDGWNYRLDRSSGALTVVAASSTGGYFLHDRCQLPP